LHEVGYDAAQEDMGLPLFMDKENRNLQQQRKSPSANVIANNTPVLAAKNALPGSTPKTILKRTLTGDQGSATGSSASSLATKLASESESETGFGSPVQSPTDDDPSKVCIKHLFRFITHLVHFGSRHRKKKLLKCSPCRNQRHKR
jgi:hypothetical protein